MEKKILCYTREPIDEFYYDARLAYSMHLAVEEEGRFCPLNHNSGVLFAKATENEDGSLNPKSLRNPYLFLMKDGRFGVLAVRTGGDGETDLLSNGQVIFFTSKDLLEYKEEGMLSLSDREIYQIAGQYVKEKNSYEIYWCHKDMDWYMAEVSSFDWGTDTPIAVKMENFALPEIQTEIEGCIPGNVITVPEEKVCRLLLKLRKVCHIKTVFPETVQAGSAEELNQIRAKAVYSDTTEAAKRVDWDLSGVTWNCPGTYEIEGSLHQDHFDFPIAYNRADPCVARWKGKYYFIATNDADNNHSLYVREADSIPELVTAPENLILDTSTYQQVGNLLWAPEFHEINGELYIFLALTPEEFFYEESHVMKLKAGGNPARKEDWSEPKRVVKQDGTELCEVGKTITLDMTCFSWENEYYVVWSQRQFVPKDLGAWLYIAKLNEKEPWKLCSKPVLLSKPDYGWANNHTFVDEGPFALPQENRLVLTFSSAAVDTSYVVGLLTIEKGKDLLQRKNWKKGNYPILTSRSVKGEFGTGHNAYVTDEYGDIWNTYHARPGIDEVRSSGIRRVHFDIDGLPVLDLTEEQDVSKEHSHVRTKLFVRK